MTTKRIILLTVCSAFLATFAQAQKTTYKFQDTQARLLDVMSNAYVKPLTVELKIISNERIVDVHKLEKSVAEVSMKGDLENIRSWAVYQSAKKHNCDVIVAATFNVESTDDGNYKVECIGFPANFTNWHTATAQDYEWIKMEKVQTTSERDKIKAVVK